MDLETEARLRFLNHEDPSDATTYRAFDEIYCAINYN